MQRPACDGGLYVYAGERYDPCEREHDLCVIDQCDERDGGGELFADGGGQFEFDIAYGAVEPGGDRL
jgi:hypothetical protein